MKQSCSTRIWIILFLLVFPLVLNAASDTDIWRNVHDGISGYSAVNGKESGVLIQTFGHRWQQLRNGLIAGVGAWGLALTVLALGLFFGFRGQVKLQQPRTGELVDRWSVYERYLHFMTAVLFLLLMLTGLILLYGRRLLLPVIEPNNFSLLAQWSKILHNYSAPLFIVGLILMFIRWFKDNLPKPEDVQWFKSYGGMIGDRHPSAGRMNGGEKAWFWLLMTFGVLLSFSGLILDFPVLGLSRQIMQYSHLVHSASAFVLMIGALGHIYIGTIGSEGAFEGMVTGKVDKSWAKQHHDLWLKKVQRNSEQSNR